MNNHDLSRMRQTNKHPHYDSDRKKAKHKFSLNMIGWSFIGMVILILLCQVINN